MKYLITILFLFGSARAFAGGPDIENAIQAALQSGTEDAGKITITKTFEEDMNRSVANTHNVQVINVAPVSEVDADTQVNVTNASHKEDIGPDEEEVDETDLADEMKELQGI